MHVEQIYRYHDRRYRLSPDAQGRWVITSARLWDTPVHRAYRDQQAAARAFWRMITATILCGPRRIRSAEIDGTTLALVTDDERLHLVEHAGPDGDHATPYDHRITALTAWRNRCCALAHTAAGPTATLPRPGHQHEDEHQ